MADEVYIRAADSPIIVSSRVACMLFGVSPQTLMDWQAGGLQKVARGKWDLQELISFRGLGSAGGLNGKAKSLAERKLEAEVSLKESQTELSRLKGDILTGKYLDAEIVDTELRRFFVVFKRSALNMARKVSGAVAPYVDPVVARRIEKDATDTVTDALEQMSVNGVYYGKAKKQRR